VEEISHVNVWEDNRQQAVHYYAYPLH
jgi:hypothetical protein